MTITKGEHTAVFVPPIAAVMPANAFADKAGGNTWSARWTTPYGQWALDYRNLTYDSPTVKIIGPRCELKLEWPNPELVLHILRELDAIERTSTLGGGA